jgi:hypothetical protein
VTRKYAIVVPSRRRAANMRRLLSLLPTAIVVVDESDVEYRKVVPASQLLTYSGSQGGARYRISTLGRLRNFIMSVVDAEYVVHIDDDLRRVVSEVSVFGRRRVIVDPSDIRAIIENGVRILQDLELPLFGWGGSQYQQWDHPQLNSFCFESAVSGAFIVRNGTGSAWNRNLMTQVDFELSMQTLLKQRAIVTDKRFFFDFGDDDLSAGGLSNLVNDKIRRSDEDLILSQWGQYVEVQEKKTRYSKLKRRRLVSAVSRKSC